MVALVRHLGFEPYALVQTTNELLSPEKIICFLLPNLQLAEVQKYNKELITNYTKMLKKKKRGLLILTVEESSLKGVGPLLNNHPFCINGEPAPLLAIIYQS